MFLQQPSDSGEETSLCFAQVFAAEVEVLKVARSKRQLPARPRPIEKDLAGLAFSGGGIRSATFNLGVLQALAGQNLLNRFDYLSTVSGGGYIGSWLSSWAYHIGERDKSIQNHISEIETELNRTAQMIGETPEPKQVYFLRRYSNYLTPRLGTMSGDTLAFVATYARNLLLNQIVLITALLSLLLIPRALGVILAEFVTKSSIWASGVLGIVLLATSFGLILIQYGF
jgi:predicted acylesterase/phospholipase RssA